MPPRKVQIRDIISFAACLIAGIGLGLRSWAHQVPGRGDLSVIEGTVSRVGTGTRFSRFKNIEYPIVFVRGQTEGFRFLDWFPSPDRIYRLLQPGDRVRLFSDVAENRWLWEIEKDGKVVVAYDEVLTAVRANMRFDPYLAIGLTAIGLAGTIAIVVNLRRGRSSSANHSPAKGR